MTSAFVCDASALVALLLDAGSDGEWVAHTISSSQIAAPALATYETANVIRRHELTGHISPDQAAQAHADLMDLAITLWPHELLAKRVWELRHNLSIYDAAYVALAESTSRPLVTLDRHLAQASGPTCQMIVP